MRRTLTSPALGLALLSGASCGPQTGVPPGVHAADANCSEGTAQIEIGDGFLRALCGCTASDPGGLSVMAPASLSCSLKAGSTVVFSYLSTRLSHQIVSSGEPTFASSPVSNPIEPRSMVRTHSVRFDAAGSYTFFDAFNRSVQGTITVQ